MFAIVICGGTASGKTTLAGRFGLPVFRAGNRLIDRVVKIPGCVPIVVEGVMPKDHYRRRLCIELTQPIKICIWLDLPRKVREDRAFNRSSKKDKKLLEHLDDPFEPVTTAEGWTAVLRVTDLEQCTWDAKQLYGIFKGEDS